MQRLGGGLAVALAGLAVLTGYIRTDEATKGYYTNRLRLAAAAGLGAAGWRPIGCWGDPGEALRMGSPHPPSSLWLGEHAGGVPPWCSPDPRPGPPAPAAPLPTSERSLRGLAFFRWSASSGRAGVRAASRI